MRRSSLACEAQSTCDAVDELELMLVLWHEVVDGLSMAREGTDSLLNYAESYLLTDCKSLYDALTRVESSGLQLKEKRTAIEVLCIK